MPSDILNNKKDKVLEALSCQLGINGYTDCTDTTLKEGEWYAIQFFEDTQFSVLTEPLKEGDDLISGRTFSAGTTLYGYFTTIQLTSGAYRAYKIKT